MDKNYLAAAKRKDFLARWGITFGGLSIIASMLLMIVFMIRVTLPLFIEPEAQLKDVVKLEIPAKEIVGYSMGPYLQEGLVITRSGEVAFFTLPNGHIEQRVALDRPTGATTLVKTVALSKNTFNVAWDNGAVSLVSVEIEAKFNEKGERNLHFDAKVLTSMERHEQASDKIMGMTQISEEEHFWRAQVLTEQRVWFQRTAREEDFTGEVTETQEEGTFEPGMTGEISFFAVNKAGNRLYLASEAGELGVWDLEDPEQPALLDLTKVYETPITAMLLLFGEESIVVGNAKGELTAWTLASADRQFLAKTHEYEPHKTGIRLLEASFRDKSFYSLDTSGLLHMTHLTSERELLTLRRETELVDFSISERGNGILARDQAGALFLWALDVPHPEVSWKTLWAKVFYEGYPEAGWVWQSSSASDDFEAKMSLMPLLYGSLKGTFYGLLFSFPLALFAAIYTSYMMDPKWRSIVKPVVELMAAIPSVVTGFLAALWLAPRLENNLVGVVMAMLVLPLITAGGLFLAFRRGNKISGNEWIYSIPLILGSVWVAWWLGQMIQGQLFAGNLNLWLFQHLGMTVDQRNCVVIGFALGFAVIPIIFTISEDALSNVPKHMSAAALALGSSRWQAMRRVILPMASPGIFAATMIGFGRAVGETMIVLMATGNTAIMSPSILNGMRTLSANIAVEIPEAPVDSTLYRILFLSAVLLFGMTFVVNTLAELVRARLNRKYKSM